MLFNLKKYRKLTDEDLVVAYSEKPSRQIIQVLFERYGHLVLGLCMKYMKQIENAEDSCSIIFEKLPNLLSKHEIRYFKSWLYQVSRNECLMILRKKNIPTVNVEGLSIKSEDEVDSNEQQLFLMENALQTLKKEQKEAVILFYLEELSYQQISELKGWDIKTVKSYIQNGKRNLKIKMEENHE